MTPNEQLRVHGVMQFIYIKIGTINFTLLGYFAVQMKTFYRDPNYVKHPL